MRKNLLAWQWSDYHQKHQNPINLRLHIFAIPLFWVGTGILIAGISRTDLVFMISGVVLCILSMAIQGAGHKREPEQPTPFEGPGDFVTRFLAEQFITYPRFLISKKR